ncbi:hypothetical protein ACGC1H_005506 [Rhizoctonia solani]
MCRHFDKLSLGDWDIRLGFLVLLVHMSLRPSEGTASHENYRRTLPRAKCQKAQAERRPKCTIRDDDKRFVMHCLPRPKINCIATSQIHAPLYSI